MIQHVLVLTPDTLSRWAGGGSAMCLSVCLRSALIGLRTAAFLWIMHSVDAFRETLHSNSGRRKSFICSLINVSHRSLFRRFIVSYVHRGRTSTTNKVIETQRNTHRHTNTDTLSAFRIGQAGLLGPEVTVHRPEGGSLRYHLTPG